MHVPYGPSPRELRDQPVWSFDTALVALAWCQLSYMDGADLTPDIIYTHMPERFKRGDRSVARRCAGFCGKKKEGDRGSVEEVAAEELDTEVGGEADTKQKKKVRRASEKGTVITHITVRLLVNATCYRF